MKRNIALTGYDGKKGDLVELGNFNKVTLSHKNPCATGEICLKIAEKAGLEIKFLKDGSQGGDTGIGSLIATEKMDYLIFFWDPLGSIPNDVYVKALLRIAALHNVPTACNRATADMIISSPLFQGGQIKREK